MDKIAFYMHGGSENHGCEAIVRSSLGIIDRPAILYSNRPKMDLRFHLDDVCEVRRRGAVMKRYTAQWFIRQAKQRILRDKLAFVRDTYKSILDEADPERLYLSIGGDNYCGDLVPALQYLNRELNQRGAKTVLWGCSIDPSYMEKPENVEDLRRYAMIFAREVITYKALQDAGLGDIARHYPDPAFTLPVQEWKLPALFEQRGVVGVNISPYVQKNGASNLVYENYEQMIRFILNDTDYGVCLIPHVVWAESDDRIPMKQLYEQFASTGRIAMLGEHNCCELKYCISQCEMLVTARTHASIAAYSTGVPTLVVGYSMKSRGIAEDLFGTTAHYVVNAWDMKQPDVLTDAFNWLNAHKESFRDELKTMMPAYIEKSFAAGNELRALMQDLSRKEK